MQDTSNLTLNKIQQAAIDEFLKVFVGHHFAKS